jgi:EamA domain-containing membrane protein RarD
VDECGPLRRAGVQSHSAPLVVFAGILDALGNVLFVFAAHSGRLDIAAILSSLYPAAATVSLSVLVLCERVTGIQTIGVLLVLLAIPLISAKAISSYTLRTPLACNLYFWTHFASKARNLASSASGRERESGLLRTHFASAHGHSLGKVTFALSGWLNP